MSTSSSRFDGRANNYLNYRPSYPDEAIRTIISTCSMEQGAIVADIGSGTGIFSDLLVSAGLEVFAVEPNEQMRDAVEPSLQKQSRFHSISGTAEATTLDDQSVDLITSAQAFHWFEAGSTKNEFRRILKPSGRVALVWNQRDTRTQMQQNYEGLLRNYVSDYENLVHTRIEDDSIDEFLDGSSIEIYSFANQQVLDFDGLLGRMKSSSYVPVSDVDTFSRMVNDLKTLFEKNQRDGKIYFDYETKLYIGTMSSS
jgi:SAM-dependent methyltransferase